jgi:uncharacterized protein YciI
MSEAQLELPDGLPAHIVIYRYVDDSSGRDHHRADHRTFIRNLHAEGLLIFSGPFTEPNFPGAVLMVLGSSVEEVHRLLDDDPFHLAGLIYQREVRSFRMGVGTLPG